MANFGTKFVSKERLQYFKSKLDVLFAAKVDKVEGKGLSANDYTDAEKTKLAGIEANANNYTHPAHTAAASGLYKVTVDALGHVTDATAVVKSDITALGIPAEDTNTTYTFSGALSSGSYVITITPNSGSAQTVTVPAMVGAGADAAGAAGLVPAPAAGDNLKFLRADGTWVIPTDTTYEDATQSVHGLMSTADKIKLDGFSAASNYALKSDLTNVYKYKGSVATYADLPSSGLTAGDVYDVQADGMNYAWNGTAWDQLGGNFTIDEITTAEIDAMFA